MMSLSKNKIRYIQSLKEKKFRNEYKTFVAEGKKLVFDLLETCRCQLLIGLPDTLRGISPSKAEVIVEATADELKKASHLKTAPLLIGVFYQPEYDLGKVANQFHLVLDGVQDPGNMGTIVRLADWFGIKDIFCSQDTVDIFNPKTVQATMGAIARVKVHYTDLAGLFMKNTHLPVFGTFLEGENIYNAALPANGFIVMGNEGNGISPSIRQFVTRQLFIPHYPPGVPTSESLNVAVATAIVCSELRRRTV